MTVPPLPKVELSVGVMLLVRAEELHETVVARIHGPLSCLGASAFLSFPFLPPAAHRRPYAIALAIKPSRAYRGWRVATAEARAQTSAKSKARWPRFGRTTCWRGPCRRGRAISSHAALFCIGNLSGLRAMVSRNDSAGLRGGCCWR